MQNQQLHPEIFQFLTLNGFEHLQTNVARVHIFLKNNCEAIVLCGISVMHKKPIGTEHQKATAENIMWHWQTCKKYVGFDGKTMFDIILILHVMDAINIKDINRRLHNQAKGHILHQCAAMFLQPETAHA